MYMYMYVLHVTLHVGTIVFGWIKFAESLYKRSTFTSYLVSYIKFREDGAGYRTFRAETMEISMYRKSLHVLIYSIAV